MLWRATKPASGRDPLPGHGPYVIRHPVHENGSIPTTGATYGPSRCCLWLRTSRRARVLSAELSSRLHWRVRVASRLCA